MKKLIFAALILLFASCEKIEFEYYFPIVETYSPCAESTIDFVPYSKYSGIRKDISGDEAIVFNSENNYEITVEIVIDSVTTKATKKSECKIRKVRKD